MRRIEGPKYSCVDDYEKTNFWLIHESWHGAQPRNRGTVYHCERWGQEETYHSWDGLYEADPPFGFRAEDQFNVLYNEWKDIDRIAEDERSSEELARWEELDSDMRSSPFNDNYDMLDDDIPKCD